jgi:uncharacterized protein
VGPGTDLSSLLRTLDPELRPGPFVFTTVDRVPAGIDYVAVVVEDEGITLVVARDVADRNGFPYEFVAAMITLRVHSSLAAVGLTAAVASLLADAGISCNVIAGSFHDHLFVPLGRADDALRYLSTMGDGSASF